VSSSFRRLHHPVVAYEEQLKILPIAVTCDIDDSGFKKKAFGLWTLDLVVFFRRRYVSCIKNPIAFGSTLLTLSQLATTQCLHQQIV
jgi:hypothetical protein